MYSKDDISRIILEFQSSDFINLKRGTKKALLQVNLKWNNLMFSTKVLTYWITHCKDENFIDTLFCEECHSYMNNKANSYPKYCSKECRSKNHNWKKDSESRKRLEQKWLEKYGSKNPFGSKKIRDKIAQTNLERFGTKHNWNKNSLVWSKIKQTNLEKYGVEYQTQSENFKEKFKETSLEHFGVEHPMKSDVVKDKVKQTNLEKYGASNVWSKESSIISKNVTTNLEKYGVPYFCMTEKCKESSHVLISKINKYFRQKLDSLGLNSVFEKQVGWYSYDLYIESLNTLIDINPSFTHSSTKGISNFKPKCKEYHYNRYKNALVNGYDLIQIWDWDDSNKILENLKIRNKVVDLGKVVDCDLSKTNENIYLSLGYKEVSFYILKHWYNCKKNLHILDNEKDLAKDGFIEVYDAGHKIFVK